MVERSVLPLGCMYTKELVVEENLALEGAYSEIGVPGARASYCQHLGVQRTHNRATMLVSTSWGTCVALVGGVVRYALVLESDFRRWPDAGQCCIAARVAMECPSPGVLRSA